MLVEKEETESTNDDARLLALQGAPVGTAVLASRQTRGRGRAGRAWESPGGGLYLSVVLRPTRTDAPWSLLPLALGEAAAEVLARHGHDVRVKWPNDLFIENDKVGGILVESRWGDAPFIIAGIGLNLADTPVKGATSLRAHGQVPDRRALARELAEGFAMMANQVESGRVDALLDAIRARSWSLGQKVGWDAGQGIATNIEVDGALIVENDKGRHRIVAGDVSLDWDRV